MKTATQDSEEPQSNSSASDRRLLPRHPIGLVCRRTGLKPDLVRAWEARYGAVQPGRSETRRRLYSDADIERLKLLRQAVSAGRGIRHVARLSREELIEIIQEDAADLGRPMNLPGNVSLPGNDGPEIVSSADLDQSLENFLDECLKATEALDANALEHQLERASIEISRIALLDRLIAPLMKEVGNRWHAGMLRPIHEHLASAAVRSFLGRLPVRPPPLHAPCLISTTPAGQVHELGALLANRSALECGWRATFLGPDLPAEEIAGGARQCSAQVVALGVTFPLGDLQTAVELKRLRDLLDDGVDIFVGGPAATSYETVLDEIGAKRLDSLQTFRDELNLKSATLS